VLLHLTRKEQDDKYDLNQLRTEPWIPNQDERRVSKMLWSVVPKQRKGRGDTDTIIVVILLHG